MRVGQDAAADAEHHGAVARHQGLEGGLVTAGQEPLQEVPLGHPGGGPRAEEVLDLPQDRAVSPARHAVLSPSR